MVSRDIDLKGRFCVPIAPLLKTGFNVDVIKDSKQKTELAFFDDISRESNCDLPMFAILNGSNRETSYITRNDLLEMLYIDENELDEVSLYHAGGAGELTFSNYLRYPCSRTFDVLDAEGHPVMAIWDYLDFVEFTLKYLIKQPELCRYLSINDLFNNPFLSTRVGGKLLSQASKAFLNSVAYVHCYVNIEDGKIWKLDENGYFIPM